MTATRDCILPTGMSTLIRRIHSGTWSRFSYIKPWMLFTATSVLCLSLAIEVSAKDRPQTGSGPLWQVDLRSFGYTGFEPRGEKWDVGLGADPICFPDKDLVVATFLTPATVSGLSRRDQANSLFPFRLHVIALESATGQVRATKEWPVPYSRAAVAPVRAGKFILLTPEGMSLYSAALQKLKDLPLPFAHHSNVHVWAVYFSPSGTSLLFEYSDPEGFHCQWIKAEGLEVVRSWTEKPGWGFSISDNEIAVDRVVEKSRGSLSEVLIRNLDGPWRVFCGARRECGSPQFVSSDKLVLYRTHELKLMRTDGEVLLSEQFRYGDEWIQYSRPPLPSADGLRFAVHLARPRGGSALLDIPARFELNRIVVYDTGRGNHVFILDGKKAKIKKVSGLALSPDGSLMAVLAHGVVRVYSLPKDPEETHQPSH